jgi:hypothetical protein
MWNRCSTLVEMRVRKLPVAEAQRLFPDEPSAPVDAPRECRSPTGRHLPVDLSSLRYRPTPPFCAWCGAALHVDRRA